MSSYKRYFIYILSSPLDQTVFYVGCTSEIKLRRRQHYKRFASEFYGLPPVFTIIDTVSCHGIWAGLAMERYWINKYKADGASLVNQRETKWQPFDIDYAAYRAKVLKSSVLDYRKITPNIKAA